MLHFLYMLENLNELFQQVPRKENLNERESDKTLKKATSSNK